MDNKDCDCDVYVVELDSSVRGTKCYLEWNGREYGRCVYNATTFLSKESANLALKEAQDRVHFLPPEVLSKNLKERIKCAHVIPLMKALQFNRELKTWKLDGKIRK